MTQKDKKPKGKRGIEVEHKTVKIIKLIKLEYIVEMLCWCGNEVTIDSSKPITENMCSKCSSPIKLLADEWTPEEQAKFIKAKGAT